MQGETHRSLAALQNLKLSETYRPLAMLLSAFKSESYELPVTHRALATLSRLKHLGTLSVGNAGEFAGGQTYRAVATLGATMHGLQQ